MSQRIWQKEIQWIDKHGVNVAEWSKAHDWELRSKVAGSTPAMPAIFQPRIATKNQQGTLSQVNSNLH